MAVKPNLISFFVGGRTYWSLLGGPQTYTGDPGSPGNPIQELCWIAPHILHIFVTRNLSPPANFVSSVYYQTKVIYIWSLHSFL